MTPEIINMTPHAITWVKPSGESCVIESSGTIRCECKTELVESIGDLEIYSNSYVLKDSLPAAKPGVYYVVSALVAARLTGRDDVLVVNETVRDSAGRIIGCKSFARI